MTDEIPEVEPLWFRELREELIGIEEQLALIEYSSAEILGFVKAKREGGSDG